MLCVYFLQVLRRQTMFVKLFYIKFSFKYENGEGYDDNMQAGS